MQVAKWIFLLELLTFTATAQQVGKPLPGWKEGQLDIHHINTGQGNASFIVFPDGTNLLIDAGAINSLDWRTNKPRNIPVKPNGDRQAGEWIARYVRHVLRFQPRSAIDYAIITHFHDDHLGTPLNVTKRATGNYVLAGITEVSENILIRKILDRGWPDYTYPRPFASDSMVINYRKFLDWQRRHNGLQVERFLAGRNDQVVLLNKPEKYRVEVRNLLVNGEIWTGDGNNTRALFPELASLKATDYPNENMCSIVLQIRYGAFDYFSGGDIQGILQFGTPAWHDVETPLANVVGPVDVQLVDHHGYADSQNGALLAKLRPRVFIIPAWATSHPGREVLERLLSEQLYPGPRDVFATNLLEEAKVGISDWVPQLKGQSGHVVVRVEPGGKSYRVFVLTDSDESYNVKTIEGPYQTR